MRRLLARLAVVVLLAALSPAVPPASTATAAESTGTGISYTLEGCRASTDAYLAGTFVCPTAQYTTGNLGKGWNEFDLVPGRVTLGAGNNAPTSQTFAFVIAVDNCSTTDGATTCSGFPGYDRLSVPELNSGLSSGTCDTTPGVSGPSFLAPGMGGTGTTLYRTVTIDGQSKNSTCVYDFYARLAFNSHLYPGSSLHFNLANTDLGPAGIGSKEVSIPVKEILPPGFTKSQQSSQGSDVVWSVGKTSTPATVTFSQTCPPTANPQSQAVTVTVTWTKTAAASGAVTVVATIGLQNNAHRSITVDLSDQLYAGATPAAGNEIQAPKTSSTVLAAGGSATVTETWTVSSPLVSAYSDVATATFKDTVFNETLGTATRTASSTLVTLPPTSGATAVITDTESMTGSTDFDFTVDSVSGVAGSFSGYTLGTHTRGPVSWSSGTVSASGSTTFNKTVYVNAPTAGTATLADTATITPAGQTTSQASASSTINGNATVTLTIAKTIPVVLGAGDGTQTFTFPVTGPAGYSSSPTISFSAGQGGSLNPRSTTLTGLAPGSYTVNETTLSPYSPQTAQVVTIDLPSCSGSATFTNNFGPASAQVRKVTVPAGSESGWEFVLSGPGTPVGGEHVTTTGTGYVVFGTVLEEGAYTITEVGQAGWDQTSASAECSFTVNYPADADRVFSCTYTNTQRAAIRIIKNAVPDDPQDFGYTTSGSGLSAFSLDDDADPTLSNTRNFTNLVPGSYSVTETLPVTGWDLTSLSCSSTNGGSTLGTNVGTGVSTITLGAGDLVICTYTNTKRGHVTVLKTENGGVPTHAYTFRLTGGPDTVSITRTTDGTNQGSLDFGLLKPGTYTLCELAVPAGTHSTLEDQGGTVNPTTGDICLSFTLIAGQTRAFTIDNSYPGGGQRTIGYWKNWNTYRLGSGAWDKAARTGNHLMDEFLPQSLGGYVVDTALKGFNVLSSPSAKYAENQLAAQLLAAKLNVAAGASTCTSVNNAIAHADALLTGIGYTGPPSSKVGNNHPQRADFLSTARTLDQYNNGNVC